MSKADNAFILVSKMAHKNFPILGDFHVARVLGQHDECDVAGGLIGKLHLVAENNEQEITINTYFKTPCYKTYRQCPDRTPGT